MIAGMALLPYVDPRDAPPDIGEILAAMPDLNLFRLVAQAPTALRPWLGLGGALLTDLELDPVLRELTILQVAQSTGCDYERVQHEPIAIGVGATPDQVALVGIPPEKRSTVADTFSVAERAVLDLADEMVRTGQGAPSQVAALREHLSDRAIVELLLVVGHYVGVALLAKTLRVDPDGPIQLGAVDGEA